MLDSNDSRKLPVGVWVFLLYARMERTCREWGEGWRVSVPAPWDYYR